MIKATALSNTRISAYHRIVMNLHPGGSVSFSDCLPSAKIMPDMNWNPHAYLTKPQPYQPVVGRRDTTGADEINLLFLP
jgi:hypothetical protein